MLLSSIPSFLCLFISIQRPQNLSFVFNKWLTTKQSRWEINQTVNQPTPRRKLRNCCRTSYPISRPASSRCSWNRMFQWKRRSSRIKWNRCIPSRQKYETFRPAEIEPKHVRLLSVFSGLYAVDVTSKRSTAGRHSRQLNAEHDSRDDLQHRDATILSKQINTRRLSDVVDSFVENKKIRTRRTHSSGADASVNSLTPGVNRLKGSFASVGENCSVFYFQRRIALRTDGFIWIRVFPNMLIL